MTGNGSDEQDQGAPASAEEALARAAAHGRTAVAEALAALRALIDAASFAARGEPLNERSLLGLLGRSLDEIATALAREVDGDSALIASLAEALDAEIERWETRARDDAQARAVLRAYLGLREILWELGLRPSRAGGNRGGRGRSGRNAPRVQRVPIED